MKKTFCDCCGSEMEYDKITNVLKGFEVSTSVKGAMKNLAVSVSIVIFAKGENGEQIDLCSYCRQAAVWKALPIPDVAIFSNAKLEDD